MNDTYDMDAETANNNAQGSKGQTGIKRNRPVQSCSECRRRKTKCDRAFPCSACILRNDPQSCREYQKIGEDPERHDDPSQEIDVQTLSRRVRQLEDAFAYFSSRRGQATTSPSVSGVSDIQLAHGHEVSGWPYVPSLGLDNVKGEALKGKGREVLPCSKAPSLEDHNAALAIEDIALNRTSKKRLENLRDPNVYWIAPVEREAGSFLRRKHDKGNVYIPGLEMLPSVEIADYLFRHFLQEYAWLLRCFHAPTLQKQWEEHSSEPVTRLNPLDIDRVAFLALRCAVMCTTMYLMDQEDLYKIGFDEQQRENITKALSDLMEMSLLKGDWGRGIVWNGYRLSCKIIGPYWSATGRSDTHYIMLGSAIKIAQTMGIHKLGPELPSSATARELSKAFGNNWIRADVRETGRRIWWLLLELDLNASPEHDFLYSAHVGERVCALPVNVNDDELSGEVSILGRPTTEHTDMTFICSRLTFLGPLKTFVKAVNQVGGRLTEAIMEKMHEDYMIAVDAVPAYYRTETLSSVVVEDVLPLGTDASSMRQIVAEARTIKCYGYSAALRLHRLCLAPALRSSSYAVCKEGATRAARWLLEHDPSLQRLPSLPCRWWPFVHGVLTASIVLLLNICYAERYLLKDLELLLRDGISSLRGHPLLQVKQVATLLETLLDQEISKKMAVKAPLEMSSSSATKRRAEDELQSERTQFRKMVEGALLEREEDDVTRLVQDPQISLLAPPVDYVPSREQGISFSVDTLNALLPNMDGYYQGVDDPLQALLQGADLGILENFLLYHPQSSL